MSYCTVWFFFFFIIYSILYNLLYVYSSASTECSAVFVKSLPPNVTNDLIENAFNKFGRVKRNPGMVNVN